MKPLNPSSVQVLELFSGCGGASLGLRRAGFSHLACIEWNAAAAATLTAAGFQALHADVRDVDYRPFVGRVDLLWASPPCQAGSTAGQRLGAADERNGWPWTFAVLDTVKPVWFLAENVLGWTYHRDLCGRADLACPGCYWDGHILPELARRFPFSGAWRLDAADFGVPQRRRRMILWGGPLPLTVDGPPRTHTTPTDEGALLGGRKPWITLSEAIGDTLLDPDTCTHRACYPCDGSHGRACQETWRLSLPSPTVTTTEVKGSRAHAPDWNFNGGPDRASDSAFLVAGVRRIEVNEGLILQGFPADWPLQGNRQEQYLQVGNAVPPALAEAVGRMVGFGHQVWSNLKAQGVAAEMADTLRRHRITLPAGASP